MSLPLRLRAATAAAHRRLETDLDLLATPLSENRFRAVLMGFWGFHAVWEPSLRRHAQLSGLLAGRSRQDLIARDLRMLGLCQADIDAIPLCAAAGRLSGSVEAALGSLYVLEGSSLGGQVIAKALSEAPWAPLGGLLYFDPYGPRTGAMWRAFQEALKAASTPIADPVVEAGARGAFAALQDWLVPDPAHVLRA